MKLKLTVDGKVYEVDVEVAEPEARAPARGPSFGPARAPSAPPSAPPPPPTAGAGADEGKVCRSPFSGTVSRVSVQVGQDVLANDVLLVIEAMKMETVVTAPVAGKVAAVEVRPGDAVTAGQVLVTFG